MNITNIATFSTEFWIYPYNSASNPFWKKVCYYRTGHANFLCEAYWILQINYLWFLICIFYLCFYCFYPLENMQANPFFSLLYYLNTYFDFKYECLWNFWHFPVLWHPYYASTASCSRFSRTFIILVSI